MDGYAIVEGKCLAAPAAPAEQIVNVEDTDDVNIEDVNIEDVVEEPLGSGAIFSIAVGTVAIAAVAVTACRVLRRRTVRNAPSALEDGGPTMLITYGGNAPAKSQSLE